MSVVLISIGGVPGAIGGLMAGGVGPPPPSSGTGGPVEWLPVSGHLQVNATSGHMQA